jgi:DHA2 family multidrug resistance protein
VRNLGGSFGIALATTLIARREQYHQSVLVEHVTSLGGQYDTVVHRLQQAYLAYSASAFDALHRAEAQIYKMVQQQAAVLSFNDCFWVMAVILAAMVPLVLLMRKPPPGAAGRSAH